MESPKQHFASGIFFDLTHMKLNKFILYIFLGFNLILNAQEEQTIKSSTEVKKEDIHTFVDEEPKYDGDVRIFIAKNTVYPKNAIDNEIEGKCYISFIVELNGKISDVKVAKGVPNCPECDQEAIRVIKSTQGKWIAAKVDGKYVKSRYMIPIEYKLNSKRKKKK